MYVYCIRNILRWSSKVHRVLLISESEDFKIEGEIGMLVQYVNGFSRKVSVVFY